MKSFLKPTTKKVIIASILFLVIPMFGTVQPMCLSIGSCDPYFGFLGIPALYIFGGLIDVVEAIGYSVTIGTHIAEYLLLLLTLLPYLLLSYLIVCILFWVFEKRKPGIIV